MMDEYSTHAIKCFLLFGKYLLTIIGFGPFAMRLNWKPTKEKIFDMDEELYCAACGGEIDEGDFEMNAMMCESCYDEYYGEGIEENGNT